jgi:hypothetical protein
VLKRVLALLAWLFPLRPAQEPQPEPELSREAALRAAKIILAGAGDSAKAAYAMASRPGPYRNQSEAGRQWTLMQRYRAAEYALPGNLNPALEVLREMDAFLNEHGIDQREVFDTPNTLSTIIRVLEEIRGPE